MDKEGFRNRLKQYKKAREENPGLKYWEWKNLPKYDEGGEVVDPIELMLKRRNVAINMQGKPNQFLDEWNAARLATGRFDAQLGNGNLELQKANRDSAPIFSTPNAFASRAALRGVVPIRLSSDTDQMVIDRYNSDLRVLANKLFKTVTSAEEGKERKGAYDQNSHTIYVKPDSPETLIHEQSHASKARPQEAKIAEILKNNDETKSLYYDDPTGREPYGRLMQVREANQIDPNKVWDKESYKEFKKNAIDFNFLNRYSDDTVIDIFNNVADAGDIRNEENKIFVAAEGGIVPKYDEGGEVEEPGLWDKFTNTVSVLYNNAARKIKNFFEEDNRGEVIDLSNQQVTRITPDTQNLTAIYGNEFVENNANNIRTRKQFEETTDTLIGDKQIPLSQISNFYGIENGKLKSGNISIFDLNSAVIPNRAKNIGKVKEIIFNDPLTKELEDSLKTIWQEEEDKKDIQFAQLADSLGVDYGRNIFSKPFYGAPYSNLLKRYNAAKHNDNEKEFVQRFNQILKLTPTQQDIRHLLNGSGMSYVTEKNDTIPVYKTAMPTLTKNLYADEYGNSLFINNLKNLTKLLQQLVNDKLKINPMYPILIDNGRYLHYLTTLPNYNTYTSFDFARDPKNMYVIGTIEK